MMSSVTGRPRSLKLLLFADVYRIAGKVGWAEVARQYIRVETFRYNVAMRVTAALNGRLLRALGRMWLRHLRVRLGINIPASTMVGPGLLIGHSGGIVVNSATVIGRDCNLSHNVTIGVSQGKRPGVPKLGDRIYIGPGAVIVGCIIIGDDVAIGANTVVADDVPSHATVVGSKARVLLDRGSSRHIHHTTEAIAP